MRLSFVFFVLWISSISDDGSSSQFFAQLFFLEKIHLEIQYPDSERYQSSRVSPSQMFHHGQDARLAFVFGAHI
jgi:hypothetical protein